MKRGGRSGRGGATALIALTALLVASTLTPAGADAVDSDLKFAYAFKLDASNGYSILAVAANERADGRGQLALIVSRKRESATYLAPAQLTATSLKANLGALGKVALEVTPSGRKKRLKPRRGCGREGRASYEPVAFAGSFEFHGEGGYTEVTSSAPTEYTRFLAAGLCGVFGGGELTRGRLPGARLRVRSLGERFRFELQANKNRPNARSHFEVELREERGQLAITRDAAVWLGANAFQYDPLLETATLRPPAPFAGVANFYRRLAPEARWSGNLTVDLPGRPGVPLTGPDLQATLVPACLQLGKAGTRADCGF